MEFPYLDINGGKNHSDCAMQYPYLNINGGKNRSDWAYCKAQTRGSADPGGLWRILYSADPFLADPCIQQTRF